jgi:hypothetical protein
MISCHVLNVYLFLFFFLFLSVKSSLEVLPMKTESSFSPSNNTKSTKVTCSEIDVLLEYDLSPKTEFIFFLILFIVNKSTKRMNILFHS